MARILKTRHRRRLAEMTADRAAQVERAAARAIDRQVEREAAQAYAHMIGADLPIEERRQRALRNLPQSNPC